MKQNFRFFYSMGRLLDLTAISLFKVILKSSFLIHLNFLVLSRALQNVIYIARKNVYPSNPDVFFSLVRCRELQTPCLPRRRLLLFNIVNLPSAPSLTLAHHLSLVTCHLSLHMPNLNQHWPNKFCQCTAMFTHNCDIFLC